MNLYLLNLNGAEAGPFTRKQLEAMWLTGGITVNTEWRSVESVYGTWLPGTELAAKLEGQSKATYEEPSVLRRSNLRESTSYPKLRQALTVFAVLDLVSAVIFVIMIFNDNERAVMYVVAAAASIISLVPLALGNVVIDIADAALKKL
jgi:hypothetical protein